MVAQQIPDLKVVRSIRTGFIFRAVTFSTSRLLFFPLSIFLHLFILTTVFFYLD